jgi:catalase
VPHPELARETPAPDEERVTGAFIAFLQAASLKRHPTGVMPRFNQGRASGCVEAEFSVPDDLPADCRVGLFAEARTYRAWIRFANATSASDRERDVRGMSIQVSGVGGENLTPGATSQDFILNSHPVMMVPGPREFLDLLQAVETGGLRRAIYFLRHPGTARTVMASRQHPSSPLDIPYWSTTPYLFGPGRAVKYIVRPTEGPTSTMPATRTATYLREALIGHLARADAAFDFLIQFQTDGRAMPIEDASVEWTERDSAYRPVARIRIPRQVLDDPTREVACEQVSFNPWHARVEHRPLGGFNRVRREIYRAMARFRQEHASRHRQITASSGTR